MTTVELTPLQAVALRKFNGYYEDSFKNPYYPEISAGAPRLNEPGDVPLSSAELAALHQFFEAWGLKQYVCDAPGCGPVEDCGLPEEYQRGRLRPGQYAISKATPAILDFSHEDFVPERDILSPPTMGPLQPYWIRMHQDDYVRLKEAYGEKYFTKADDVNLDRSNSR